MFLLELGTVGWTLTLILVIIAALGAYQRNYTLLVCAILGVIFMLSPVAFIIVAVAAMAAGDFFGFPEVKRAGFVAFLAGILLIVLSMYLTGDASIIGLN